MSDSRSQIRATVVVPTFNRAALLREALDSALAQTFEGFRVIVLDNASTDETPELVAGLDDPRLLYIRRDENVGLFANFQDALNRIDTEYGLILSDDDRISPGFLAETIGLLDREGDVGFVHTAFDIIDANGNVVESGTDWTYGLADDATESGTEFVAESMRWGCRVCSSAALMRMSAVPESGFEEGDFPAIDFGLWLRMALDSDVAFLARPLAAYRIHEHAQTATFGRPVGAGYDGGLAFADRRLEVKRRFLDGHRPRLEDVGRLGRLAAAGKRHELLWLVHKSTHPGRRPLATLRGLVLAARQDLRIATEKEAWLLLLASILRPRGIALLKKLRRRSA